LNIEAVNGYGRASRSASACLLASTQRPDPRYVEGRVLAFGAMSEKRLAIFAVSSLGFVAVVLFGFWLALRLAD
jgi:hypothetical protein